jgi:hypothetical protein
VEFSGAFETHLTLLRADCAEQLAQGSVDGHCLLPAELRSIREYPSCGIGDHRSWKFLHIVLERGAIPTQPMISYRGQGGLSEQVEVAQATAQELERSGFSVTRIKIEAALENSDIPCSNVAAQDFPNCYFEYHLKLLLAMEMARSTLIDLVQPYGAHLSQNARRQRSDGQGEYFVTQRCGGVGLRLAQQRFQDLAKVVADQGYFVISSHGEYVVYDSNIDLDRGWISTV